MPEQIETRHFMPLRMVTAVRALPGGSGVEMQVDDARLQIEVLRADLVRLRVTRGGMPFDEYPTHAVCADLSTPAFAAPHELTEDERSIRVATERMVITVTRSPFRVDAHRADGSVIFETAEIEGESGQPGKLGAYCYLNDEFIVARRCRREDAFLGLGEKTGPLNRKGRSYTLWNTDVLSPDASGEFTRTRDKTDPRADPTSAEFDPYYISIPFFYHLSHQTGAAAGFFIDNGYRGHFEFQHPDEYRFHFSGGQYCEYVFAGPRLADILQAYTNLTGRMAAPPLWALGYHQCRWHTYTQNSYEELARRFNDHALPCDALWLDIEYMRGYRVFTWNAETFPDPPGLLDFLRERGMRAISIIDPGVKIEPGYELYDDGLAKNVFCKTAGGMIYAGQVWPGRTAFPDFSTEAGRRWWGEKNARHIQSGLAGIWNDMNEPATGDIPNEAMRFGPNGEHPHDRFHNQYALLMAMSTREGLLAAMPTLRTFILSRAGSSGIQRYAANWMGDNMARWDHFQLSMPMALGLGLSGQPFVGADIGGFAENTNAELLVRWMQAGALTPFFRNHNNAGNIDQYPWSFGEAVMDLVREAVKLRYRLLPTVYTEFIRSSETGLPVQRPLVLDYQFDRTARDVDDQYLLGESLMVAPVTTAGATMRHVYLPRGTWHDWNTGKIIVGPRIVTADAPMERIPLYARGGAVIALWPDPPLSTMGYHPAVVELHVFLPEEDGAFISELHEDDGLTFAYKEGACRRTTFTLKREGSRVTLDAAVTGSGYPEFARAEFTIVFHGGSPDRIEIDGQPSQPGSSVLRLQNAGEPFSLTARIGGLVA